jgi:hypothetical protein
MAVGSRAHLEESALAKVGARALAFVACAVD